MKSYGGKTLRGGSAPPPRPTRVNKLPIQSKSPSVVSWCVVPSVYYRNRESLGLLVKERVAIIAKLRASCSKVLSSFIFFYIFLNSVL